MNKNFGGFSSSRVKQQKARLLLIGGSTIAFTVFAVGVFLFSSHLDVDAKEVIPNQQDGIVQSTFESVPLIVPVASVVKNEKLSNVKLREIQWPRNDIPTGAVRDMNEIRGMFAKTDLPANHPILKTSLSKAPVTSILAELIPPGHRAVTIEVSATAGVEGWATPGSHVDVLLTYRDSEDKKTKTRVAVEDAVVLSFQGKLEKGTANSEVSNVSQNSTVTLAVSARDTLKIRTASAMGRISLVLRRTDDPTTTGGDVFEEGQFGEPKRVEEDKPEYVSNGYLMTKDKEGNDVTFELGKNNRWWKSNNPDDEE